jgi:hypothetical protein
MIYVEDPAVLKLMKVWKETYKIITTSLPTLHKNIGRELATQFVTELDDPAADLISILYFTWARKAQTGLPLPNINEV